LWTTSASAHGRERFEGPREVLVAMADAVHLTDCSPTIEAVKARFDAHFEVEADQRIWMAFGFIDLIGPVRMCGERRESIPFRVCGCGVKHENGAEPVGRVDPMI